MSARRLDGAGVAAAIRGELAARIAAFTAAARAAARAGHRPGRRRSGLGDLRPEQAAHRRRGRLPGRPGTAGGDGQPRRGADRGRSAQRTTRRSTASWCSRRCRGAWAPGAEQRVFDAIRPDKDVDGFHPRNVGLLVQKRARLVACTPSGVIELLERERIPIAGRHAVVHRAQRHRRQADGAAAAAPRRHRDRLPFADAGRGGAGPPGRFDRRRRRAPGVRHPGVRAPGRDGHRRRHQPRHRRARRSQRFYPDGHPRRRQFADKGSLVIGDVHPAVEAVAGALTPVPGGVGPLTVAMLLHNTVVAAEDRAARQGVSRMRRRGPDRRHRDRQERGRGARCGRKACRSWTPTPWPARRWRPAAPACARWWRGSAAACSPPTGRSIAPPWAGSSSSIPPPAATSSASSTPGFAPESPRSSLASRITRRRSPRSRSPSRPGGTGARRRWSCVGPAAPSGERRERLMARDRLTLDQARATAGGAVADRRQGPPGRSRHRRPNVDRAEDTVRQARRCRWLARS